MVFYAGRPMLVRDDSAQKCMHGSAYHFACMDLTRAVHGDSMHVTVNPDAV